MKRLIDWHLKTWKESAKRKPLLLKGARQIGKTYSVRRLGTQDFESFVEINFELTPGAKTIFEKDLQPERILWELSLLANVSIIPDKTLLFLDEVQAAPQAILALRYFYELMPDLHVIAAGSLLDFAIEKIGVPVGRIQMFYVYPLSFIEFLSATKNELFIETILRGKPLSEILHTKLLDLLGQYLAIGGMPEAVRAWIETKDPRASYEVQTGLIETYRLDFPKYAKKHQIPYLEVLFNQIHHFIGKQFKYSAVHGDYKKRELVPCLALLQSANIIHAVIHSAGHGIPIGAEANIEKFKLISLDIGLAQSILGVDLVSWFLNPDRNFINRGPVAEAFVGQELLAYASPHLKTELFYWKRESAGSLAEVDYLYNYQNTVLPIEVKSGHGSTLRSLHQFLESHPNSPRGMRFWSEHYLMHDQIESRPLYAVATIAHPDQAKALESLCKGSNA